MHSTATFRTVKKNFKNQPLDLKILLFKTVRKKLSKTILKNKFFRKYKLKESLLCLKKLRLFKHIKKSFHKKPVIFIPVSAKLKYFFIGTLFSSILIFIPLVILIFIQDLPNPHELSLRQLPQTTKIYDRNKVLLYEIYIDENRTLVMLRDIPKTLQQATLAIEDKNFYKHPGFDITSIIRALKENIAEGKPIQGGSTITQQLIKTSFFSNEKKLSRKVKELVLAFWAEHIYSKNKILEMYFNQVPYGGTAWGAEAAAEVYFGKHVKQLSLSESAFLAGLTQAPTMYSPYGHNSKVWKNRQKEVLSRMRAIGYISAKQEKEAVAEKLQFLEPKAPLIAPHFVMYIRDLLINHYGISAVEKGGLNVITSLDLKKQEMVQKIVTDEVNNNAYLNLTNGAALVTDPYSGDILAMVGGKDYIDPNGGNVNLTTALRQPGSTVKVITYSQALLKGLTPATIIDDSLQTFQGGNGAPIYSPVNYDGHYFGKVTLRFALANSLNLAAVKTLQRIGVSQMVKLGQDMGESHWENPEKYGLSVTLGSADSTMLDMATVFGTLKNGGERVDLNPIILVTDSRGTILEQKTDITRTRILPTGVAYIITDIISDNKIRTPVFGSNSPLEIPNHKVAVKTGTSDNKRDNWVIGFSKNYLVAVWVGNNDNSPMSPTLASGITGAAPIWHQVMVNLLEKTPELKVEIPPDVVTKFCQGKMEYFYKGTENSVNCGVTSQDKLFPTH
jgi:penicillin-binding protein 1C